MVSILTLVLILFGVIGITLAAMGGVLLFKKMKYDRTTTATVTDVKCQEGTGKCNITLKFKDQSDNEITGSAIVSDKPDKDSKRKIMYDSANPSAFYPSVPPVRAIGAGMFLGGLFVIIVCVGIAIFRYIRSRPQPILPPQPSISPLEKQQYPEQLPQPEPAAEKSSWFSPFSPKSAPAAPELPQQMPQKPQADASPKSAKSRSSRKQPDLEPDQESLRAKQYADQMVQKVAEPARKSPSWF